MPNVHPIRSRALWLLLALAPLPLLAQPDLPNHDPDAARIITSDLGKFEGVPGQDSPARARLPAGLERYLDGMADSGFAFSVFVAERGKTLLHKGYGWIDAEKKEHANDRTLYNIASITKSFTATAVFSLMEKGLVRPSDSLPMFFRRVPPDKCAITIAELLAHTAGLPQHYAADGVADRDSAVGRIFADTLLFAPGSGFTYSNENYELLGAIIEVVTGQRYEEALRERILRKAGMRETRFWAEPSGPGRQNVAAMNRTLAPAMLARNWGYIGSGGIYSNVMDLSAWFNALLSDALIDSAHRRQMWAVQRQLTETRIASGWFVSSSPAGAEIWTRGTEDWGHNGVVRWFPDRMVLVIVLSNSGERGEKNTTANRFISDEIVKMLIP